VTALTRCAALVLAVVLLAGCGDLPGPSDQGSARDRATAIVDEVRRAVEEAKRRAEEQSGAVERETPARGVPIRTDTQTAFEYERYQQTLESVFASLEQYWSQELPEAFGVEFTPPSRYVYYRPEEAPGPRCGQEQAPARNAFYCPAGDFIAWDESGLMIPYYVQAGDFAAAFVLAHEFGHAMQARIPQRETLTVVSELQADCFAGSWARFAEQQQDLDSGDLDEATTAVLSAADVPGTPFTDPRAHGTGFERIRAFTDGYEDGARACSPARADDWLVTTVR
jgi:predicted metalloprotease